MKDFIKAGTDVRNLRKPLNELARRVPREIITEGAVSNYDGDRLSFSALGEELYWIRLESKTGTTPIKYAFTVMQHDRTADTWIASPITGSTTDNTYAVELNNASVTTGDGKRYRARMDQSSGRWIFDQGGTGGGTTQDIKGKDILLLLLGTFDEYKDCQGAPPDPPKKANGDLCEPAYAWAAYKICGYKFTKLFDARAYGTWAIELNGQTAGSYRRFHPAFFGWDDYADGQPSGDEACAGVRFLKSDLAALSCLTCPPWVETTDCIKLTFTTPARPCPPPGYCDFNCTGMMYAMDQAGAWDKTFNLILCRSGCNFSFSGTNEEIPFNINISFEEIPRGSPTCHWGPAEIDPCDPCFGFGRWKFCFDFIPPTAPIENCDCAGLIYLTNDQMHDLIVDCVEIDVPYTSCNGCIGESIPYSHFDFIIPSSVKLNCCTEEESATCAGGGGGGGGGGPV